MLNIIAIIDRLLLLIVKWAVQREQLKSQRQRDELLRDPSAWFQGHFNGDSNNANSVPTDTAEKTDKANTSDSKAN